MRCLSRHFSQIFLAGTLIITLARAEIAYGEQLRWGTEICDTETFAKRFLHSGFVIDENTVSVPVQFGGAAKCVVKINLSDDLSRLESRLAAASQMVDDQNLANFISGKARVLSSLDGSRIIYKRHEQGKFEIMYVKTALNRPGFAIDVQSGLLANTSDHFSKLASLDDQRLLDALRKEAIAKGVPN